MNLFHASLSLAVLQRYYEIFKAPLNVLLSVAYNEQERSGFLVDFRYMVRRIFGDSGAWSVAKGSSNLTFESVISHFQMWGHLYDLIFNFDTDFSDKGFNNNIVNQIIMEYRGLRPVPVVHNFFDQEIPYYINAEKYDWLALGSSQSSNFDDFRYAIDRIKKWGNQKIKIHWFGGSKFDWLIQVPVASCDTTSWAATGAYGCILYWNDEYDDLYKMNKIYISGPIQEKSGDEGKRQFHFTEYPWRKELEEYLFKTFGLTYGDLCGYNEKFHMQLVNTRFFTELERRINEERIKRGIPLV